LNGWLVAENHTVPIALSKFVTLDPCFPAFIDADSSVPKPVDLQGHWLLERLL
jgi:hypothetical protein